MTTLETQDLARLEHLSQRVFALMRDGHWRTFAAIQALCGGSEASVSARLRELRRQEFGGHRVDRRRTDVVGVHEYRVVVDGGQGRLW